MSKLLITLTLSLFFSNQIAGVFAQNNTQNPEPVLHKVSNKAVVQSVYPEATKVEKVNEFWFKIIDDKNKLFGYAMTSTDFCKDVIGYNDVTPIMVVTDKNYIIKKVALLSNYESPSYVRRLQQMGFFGTWDDLKLTEARKTKADAFTGATMSAKAIEKNLFFLIDNGGKKLPKK